ncbi:tRNA 2-selenouridine(34) synthase MnmH [uncultured Draconibacterium sp.]|uniref:tRNA 2-selenouridine(34) synthase MnmH n=1 Tax=uncultured Draconibacterium sp. TaxID=1573823 RepID=UPI0032164160
MNTFAAMLKEITFSEYLVLSNEVPLIDVRSPGEFLKGHIPFATNIPLFTNDERAKVGTVYKQQSKEKAIELGYTFVNPKLDWFITESESVAPAGKIAVHCWRGGMRSKSFAGHLHENGFETVYVIKGGYKAFRNHALESFKNEANICILGGYTGSAKTYILKELEQMGEQIIDLEGLANHKGSAFGNCGNQPTIEQFENDLFWQWKDLDYTKTIWVEDESHRIGSVNIPMNFFENMRNQLVLFLDIPREERARHLVNDYAQADKEMLADSVNRISKRLGGLDTQKALVHLAANEFYETAMITLKYYDKYYLRGLQNREHDDIFPLEIQKIDFKQNAKKIIKHHATIVKTKHKTHSV